MSFCNKFGFFVGVLMFVSTAIAQDVKPNEPLPMPTVNYQTTTNNQGDTIWRADINSGCQYSDHNYSLDIPVDPNLMSDIVFTMTNYDVDYNDPQSCLGGPEVDITKINDSTLGILTGANNSWSTNSWKLDKSQIIKGNNKIYIDTDSTNTGCWCVGVGYIEVRAKVGFEVTSSTPQDKDINRDFRANKLNLTFEFSDDVDPSTLSDKTFRLEYQSGGTPVTGNFQLESPKKIRFIPDSDLKDGVRYKVTVVSGTNGVKAKSGAELKKDYALAFSTVPNLDLSDSFDYGGGSVCPPSTSPCPGLEVAVFQTARNQTMVPNKLAVARLYLRWKKHNGVPSADQITEMDVEASLNLAATTRKTVKRPDGYTAQQRDQAANTINLYHTPNGNYKYEATVTPLPQTNIEIVKFTQANDLNGIAEQPKIKFDYYTLKDGAWATGVPSGVQPASKNLMASGSQFTQEQFPAISFTFDDKGEHSIGYTLTGNTKDYNDGCGVVNEVSCPNSRLFFFAKDMSEIDCAYSKLSSMLGGKKFVAATVPNNLCVGATAFAIGNKVFMHQFGAGGNHATIAHEIGHIYGISKANDPTPGHRNDSTGVEGFRVLQHENRSRIETNNAQRTVSLMYTALQPDKWIHNEDYKALFATVKTTATANNAKATAVAGKFLIVSGTVNTTTGDVTLVPTFLQEVPNDDLLSAGECLLELINGQRSVLSSTYFDPGREIIVESVKGGHAYSKQSVTEDRLFNASLPWDDAGRGLRISCGNAVLLEEIFTVATPLVKFTNISDGDTLSGKKIVQWSANDTDSPNLAYQLQSNHDNAGWIPLTFLLSTPQFELDTTTLPSSDQVQLRIMVTDGFNTAYDVKKIAIQNKLTVTAVDPTNEAKGTGEISINTPISALFDTPVSVDNVTNKRLNLSANGVPVSGELSLANEDRKIVFTPDKALLPSTTYTATLSADFADTHGNTLEQIFSWSFTTESDRISPVVSGVDPVNGDIDVPMNTVIEARFDKALKGSTVSTSSFSLSDTQQNMVSGSVNYNASDNKAVFIPSQPLAANTSYIARLATTITDTVGNFLEKEFTWQFTTGGSSDSGYRITDVYRDEANDIDGDGLFDQLTILVQVQVSLAGIYNLNGRLTDINGHLLGWATTGNISLTPGFHVLSLIYSGVNIRSNGVDGPYFMGPLNFYAMNDPNNGDLRFKAYQTFPYKVTTFFSELSFGGIPNVTVQPGQFYDNIIDLKKYTAHAVLPLSEVSYKVFINTDPKIGLTIDPNNNIDILPQSGVGEFSDVTILASDTHGNSVQASFRVNVGTLPAPPPVNSTSIPTLSEYGVLLMSILLVLSIWLRRRVN